MSDRRTRAERALGGYANGPDAPVRATALALAKVDGAAGVVLVEGISDQIAVETAAAAVGRDLAAERVVVVPVGGAQAIGRYLTRFGPLGAGLRLAGLCDLCEEAVVRRGLVSARVGAPETRGDLAGLGFFVCVDDLEDELIRALGTAAVESLFEAQGDLGAFRSMRGQPAWRDREPGAQMRRFLGSGARRKLYYARVLVAAAVDRQVLPCPLAALLAAV